MFLYFARNGVQFQKKYCPHSNLRYGKFKFLFPDLWPPYDSISLAQLTAIYDLTQEEELLNIHQQGSAQMSRTVTKLQHQDRYINFMTSMKLEKR